MTTLDAQELAAADAPSLRTAIPGPLARAAVERDEHVTSPSLPRAYPFVPVRGAGCVVEDIDGNLFLDFNAGIAVTSTGHCHPDVVAAIRAQAGELLHYSSSDFYVPNYAELCEELARVFPGTQPARAFLTNSGTEGVEAAIKLARWHTRRQHIVAFLGAFHGRSYGSVSLTASKSHYRAGFSPLLPGVYHAPYADSFKPGRDNPEMAFETTRYLEDVLFKRLVDPHEVAALVVEPIQGEGGYVIPPDGWLASLREICDRYGILLVADEVQSGAGRTGRMWAIEHTGVEPDILVAGKGIASGLPLGAIVAHEDVFSWTVGTHGSTYGGSPVSCAAGLATLRLLEDGLVENAAAMGAHLLSGLARLGESSPLVVETRGVGLMAGVELTDHEAAAAVERECFERGLLVLGAGDSAVRISPPLVIDAPRVDRGLEIFGEALAAIASRS
jgi:4-aminobutyrate aminotransferase